MDIVDARCNHEVHFYPFTAGLGALYVPLIPYM